jgi:hypothetical protein
MTSKPLSEMTVEELLIEQNAWLEVVSSPKGPDMPNNSAREAAHRLYQEACAWESRRMMEITNGK